MAAEIESKPSEIETLRVLKASLLILTGDNLGIKTKEKIIPETPKTIRIIDITARINLLIESPVLIKFINIILLLNFIIFI